VEPGNEDPIPGNIPDFTLPITSSLPDLPTVQSGPLEIKHFSSLISFREKRLFLFP
jgi:hypothetical protein